MLPLSAAEEKLTGYPPEILAAYKRLLADRRPGDLDEVVFGILLFLLPERSDLKAGDLPEETDLRGDLGVDSITIAEMVFLVEDLFELSISNEDLAAVHTVADLKALLHTRLELA
ncbi:MAG: hypothetical protein JJT96_00650 [Opitutales bacterium]|nr:hypothetical protein [Opitutales bacterium]